MMTLVFLFILKYRRVNCVVMALCYWHSMCEYEINLQSLWQRLGSAFHSVHWYVYWALNKLLSSVHLAVLLTSLSYPIYLNYLIHFQYFFQGNRISSVCTVPSRLSCVKKLHFMVRERVLTPVALQGLLGKLTADRNRVTAADVAIPRASSGQVLIPTGCLRAEHHWDPRRESIIILQTHHPGTGGNWISFCKVWSYSWLRAI